jgi:hypothetical protein
LSPASRIPPVVPVLLAVVVTGAFASGAAADWCLFPLLGVCPGVALAALLPLERGTFARWTLGLVASPLVVTVCAWALMRAGLSLPVAARAVAGGGLALWLWTESRRDVRTPAGDAPGEGLRFAWGWALGSAALVGVVMFANPVLQLRGDAWVHAGIVSQILERGIPPQDPRFAGLTLNYVWFYNYFIALLASLRGGDPFAFMAISNAFTMFATMGLAWLIGRQVWGTARAAAGSALLMGLGLNAGILLLWPVRLLYGLVGRIQGPDEIRRILDSAHWNDTRVIYELTFPRAYMVNFLDKPLHGTAINIAYAFMLAYLWAMTRAPAGGRGPALAWGAIATSGMFFFHGVVGLSVVPVALAALGFAWLIAGRREWLPRRGGLFAFAAATFAGVLLAAPYTIAISKAWPAAESGLRYSYIRLEPATWVTLATSLAVAAWFARRSVSRLARERRGPAAVVALFTLGMLGFASVVSLPLGSHAKFVFEVFAGLVVLGGAAVHDEIGTWRRHLGVAGAAALAALLLLSTPALTLRGFLLERPGVSEPDHRPAPAERALHAWMRAATPADAVFVDYGFRSLLMVGAGRQLLLGSRLGPELAAFPLGETLKRRAVMADLYGRADSLERDVALLSRLHRPAYVLLRAADADSIGPAAARLAARPDLFARIYDRDGFIVYHVKPTDATSTPTP